MSPAAPGAPSTATLGPLRRMRVNVRSSSRVFLNNAPVIVSGAAFVVVLVLFSDHLSRGPHLFVGVALGMVASGLAFVVPWDRLPGTAPVVVPLLSLVALGVLTAGNVPVAMLAVFPVLTLARVHGPVAAAVGVAVGTLVAWLPLIATPVVITSAHLPSLLLLPLVLVTVAVTIHRMETSRRARSRLLAHRDGTLQQLLDDLVVEREMLEGILASLPAGVLVLDGRRVVLANPQVERLYGPVDADAEHPWRVQNAAENLAESEDDEAPGSLAARAVAGEPLESETQWWRDADGDRKAVRGTSVALPSPGGARPLRVVLFEDLTEEERAIERREDFVRAVSHELRTPLTSVVGYLDLVREGGEVPEELVELLEVADRNAQRVLRMVDDLAIASHLREGSLVAATELHCLGEIARESIEAARYDAAVAGVGLESVSDGDWPVRGDRDRLRHAVDHLVSNAVLYSEPGGCVTVALSLRGATISLVVLDRGIGIPEADRPRVFERFYRAPAVMGGSRHGTGLGLPVAREIVTGHGGEVHVRSRSGGGTEAEILLPSAAAPHHSQELVR